MATDGARHTPGYDVAIVESVILELIAELHPRLLTTNELSRRVVRNCEDRREMETLVEAVRNLRECGLFRERDDEIVEPTLAGLHAVARLT
jgi:hypothetical protein